MTTYNTGNAVPSTNPKDLYDNAQALDEAVNSTAATFTDRLGNERTTLFRSVELGMASVSIYPDHASGVAAVGEGGYFCVPAALDSEWLVLYRVEGGTYVEKKRLPSVVRIDEIQGRVDTAESNINALDGRLDTAEGDINAVEGRATTLEGRATALEGRATAAESGISYLDGTSVRQYPTLAAMTDDLTPADGIQGIVTNDPDEANNGWYEKSGASGDGGWTILPDRPVFQSEFQAKALQKTDRNVPGVALDISDKYGKPSIIVLDNGRAVFTSVDIKDLLLDGQQQSFKLIPGVGFAFCDPAGRAAIVIKNDGSIRMSNLSANSLNINGKEINPSLINTQDRYVRGSEVLKFYADISSVSAWGSSSAHYIAGEFENMVSELSASATYYNGGQPGETSQHIAGRLGSVPILLSVAGGEIPATGSVAVTPSNAVISQYLKPYSGTLNGVNGVLSSTATEMTFTRSEDGDSVSATGEYAFIPDVGTQHRSDVIFLWMGKNDTGVPSIPVQDIIDRTNISFDWLAPQIKRCLVLGHFVDTDTAESSSVRDKIYQINSAYKDRYGDLYVDVQGLITSSEVWGITGITPTTTDLEQQAIGNKPPSLSTDNLHLNAAGNFAVRTIVQQRIELLGWY